MNRAYKMSRLNSDNKLKFGKRSLKKKRRSVLSPLNFTRQVLIRPKNFTEDPQLLDTDLDGSTTVTNNQDNDMDDDR